MCDVVEALDHDSDPLPIGTFLDLSLLNTAPDTRYSYDQTNTKVFNNTLSASLPLTPTTPPTPEVLDHTLHNLSTQFLMQYTFLPPRLYPMYE